MGVLFQSSGVSNVHFYMKLFSFLASVALVRSGLVQDDGTVRDSDGTLCASNERNQLRVKPCDSTDARQVFDKAHFEATGQIKNVADNTCWLIRCDTNSPRLDQNQLIWSMSGNQIKNAYTDSVTSDHCVAFRNNGYPLKMKPCTHRKTFEATV